MDAHDLGTSHAHVEPDLRDLFSSLLHDLRFACGHFDRNGKQQRLRGHGARLILAAQARERDTLGGRVLIEHVDPVFALTQQVRLTELRDEPQARPAHGGPRLDGRRSRVTHRDERALVGQRTQFGGQLRGARRFRKWPARRHVFATQRRRRRRRRTRARESARPVCAGGGEITDQPRRRAVRLAVDRTAIGRRQREHAAQCP